MCVETKMVQFVDQVIKRDGVISGHICADTIDYSVLEPHGGPVTLVLS